MFVPKTPTTKRIKDAMHALTILVGIWVLFGIKDPIC
jgi:hypothetical protein